MKSIYGTVGYSYLKNKNKILLFADKHDTLPSCPNKINMAPWLKSKFNSSIILLEEVPRIDDKLVGLWEAAEHTKELKDMYLENPEIVKPVDIRHFILPFSWEIIDKKDNTLLEDYIKNMNLFFCLKNEYLITNLSIYNIQKLKYSDLGKHFLEVKEEYRMFLEQLVKLKLLKKTIYYIVQNHSNYLEEINGLASKIMEWYICACIQQYNDKSLLIHVGLAHSEQILDLLQTKYYYTLEEEKGINKLDDIYSSKLSGCVQISDHLNQQFGGYFY